MNYLRASLMDLPAPAPSAKTLLHAFLPHKYVDHSHPLDVLAIANQEDSENLARRVFGDRVGYVPYVIPGFLQAKAAANEYRRDPQAEGLLLGKQGLVTFGDTARESYARTVELNNLAADFVQKNRRNPVFISLTWPGKEIARLADTAPILRGCLAKATGQDSRKLWILNFRRSDLIREFVNGKDLMDYANRGTLTSDYFLRTNAQPVILPFPEAATLEEFRREAGDAVAEYVARYRNCFERHNFQSSVRELPLDPFPRIALVRGCGLFGIGKSAEEAAIVADLAETWIETVTTAEAIGRFRSLDKEEQIAIEYRSRNHAESGSPCEARLARHVVLVTGGSCVGNENDG